MVFMLDHDLSQWVNMRGTDYAKQFQKMESQSFIKYQSLQVAFVAGGLSLGSCPKTAFLRYVFVCLLQC